MTLQPPQTPDDDKRQALLDAARELFLKNTYGNISIRRIADHAKVNSALIAYYFGSKSGLFREMIRSYIGVQIERAHATLEHLETDSLAEFLAGFYRNVPPELTHLAIRTLLFERSELRDWLIETLMKPAFAMATKVAERLVNEHGKPVDPLIVRTAMQSMLVAPKLLQPVLQELHPEDINDDFYQQLAQFQAQLISTYFELETQP